MDNYEDIKKIINEAGSMVDFAEFGHGISDEWIDKAEKRLAFSFPNSYKWWLKNYGGGEIGGEEIFSVYEMDFDTVVGGDIVYINELNRKQMGFTESMLSICETEDEIYYFDASVKKANNEYPIYALYQKTQYADDFLQFLKKRIKGDN